VSKVGNRLADFFEMCRASVYEEVPVEPHISITRLTIESMADQGMIRAGMKLLDIGCGQGHSIELFQQKGIDVTGVTLGPDLAVCRSKQLPVVEMDQNEMTFEDASFDFIFARHVLEHSPIPLFTIFEYRRILKPNGLAYIEVPAPGTCCQHELNPNHYSVFTPSCWAALFLKAGFQCDTYHQIDVKVPLGGDIYYSFFLERRRDA
jgi:SAM-dependent methyltransferase